LDVEEEHLDVTTLSVSGNTYVYIYIIVVGIEVCGKNKNWEKRKVNTG